MFRSDGETVAARDQADFLGPECREIRDSLLLGDLFKNHWGRLYRFVLKHVRNGDDAEDIAQQAFVEAARSVSTYRGQSKISTWLYGIAMNLVRNYLSRSPHKVYKFEEDEVLVNLPAASPCPAGQLELLQQIGLLENALAGMPGEMRETLLLVSMEEMSYEDAARTMSIPVGTVRSRVSRARSHLRERLTL